MSVRFVTTVDQVKRNAAKLHSFASSDNEAKKFHQIRVRNALHHVVLDSDDGLIFAPAKWCGAAENDINTYFANKDPITDHFRRVLRSVGFHQVSPDDERHAEIYDQFVNYCSNYGFTHSKPSLGKRHYHILTEDDGQLYPDELPQNEQGYWEGARTTVIVNRYERDRAARSKCIEHRGASCSVCAFNFGETYGELGAGFIHVHHIVALSKLDKEYRVDPIKDLEPVCPNCHAMLHRERPYLTVEELRKRLSAKT